jgi:hypothetical protein
LSEDEAPGTSTAQSPFALTGRRAWTSDLAYLRAVFRAKRALDRIEDEAGTRVPSRPWGFGTEDEHDPNVSS